LDVQQLLHNLYRLNKINLDIAAPLDILPNYRARVALTLVKVHIELVEASPPYITL